MRLEELVQRLAHIPELDAILDELTSARGHAYAYGAAGVARGLLIARLHQIHAGPVLALTYQSEQVERICEDLRAFGVPHDQVFPFPALERDMVLRSAVDYGALGERMAGLRALAHREPSIVVATPEAAFQRVAPAAETLGSLVRLRAGESVALDMVLHRLTAIGYANVTTVTLPGHFARRGGILDVFPIGASQPVRIEMLGDEIESIRRFDPTTQRSVGSVAEVEVLPVRGFVLTAERASKAVPRVRAAWERRRAELLRDGRRLDAEALDDRIGADVAHLREREYFEAIEDYIPYIVPEDLCALDYLLAGTSETDDTPGAALRPVVVLDDPQQLETQWARVQAERAEARERRLDRGDLLEGASWDGICARGLDRIAGEFAVLGLSPIEREWALIGRAPSVSLHTAAMESFRNRTEFLEQEVSRWIEQDALCVVATDQPQRTREVLVQLGIPMAPDGTGAPGGAGVVVAEGRLRQGLKFDEAGLYVLTDSELYGRTQPVAARKRAGGGIPISTLLDLREGDYVVHIVHGIGVYRGLTKRTADGAEKDFLSIQYAGSDRLYVPADQIDRIQRYIGAEGARPALNRLGGSDWQRTTRRVQEQARELARELIELYAARETAERPPFDADSPWQAELEDAFPYEETPGQLRAIEDVKNDLASGRPADRLICGDVGFGKTEVAIRAAFKVVEAGKQVAVLCPTTVLAAQHHTTFTERLAAYPIRIELLSRFRSRQEQKRTVTNLGSGATDIVVGTHRLLSRDVEFAKLGLLIIDEEQRFGVAQKERLKQLRTSVDVLTLTATPIPRTLSMALSGLREMSVIEDPPEGRLPIVTYVHEYDDDLVRDAILRELERDGQVYFVHNRVETIESVAQRVQKLVPDARIRIGHGQMSEDELEQIMYGFYHREYDVLVCTTIIENGLDIPNVNTIILDNAEHLGLAQLYQLRGRVGRSSRQAYAFLLVRRGRVLSEEAERRLLAVREFTALGSGYQIAMRDLEIRGAGNILGAQQSGAMSAVGFDMYCRLLAQAVAEARGLPETDDTLPPADLPVTAHIPSAYIPNEAERIFFYKRMSGVQSASDIRGLQEELEDRYGDPPKPVWTALEVLRLRLHAKQAGLAAIRYENRAVTFKFGPDVRLTPKSLDILTHAFKGHHFTADSIILNMGSPRVLEDVEAKLKVIARALALRPEQAGAVRQGGVRT